MNDPATTYYFHGVTAEIVYEYIDQSDGHWHLRKQAVHAGRDSDYAATVLDVYESHRREHEGRADRRLLRIQVRPADPAWLEVTDLELLDNVVQACRNATWTPAPDQPRNLAARRRPVSGEQVEAFLDGLVAGGSTNIE